MVDEPTNTENSTTETTEATTTTPENETVEQTALGGAGETTATTEGATTEAATTEAAAVPESYELTAPEGLTLDPKDIEAATPVFKELGLNNEQANKLMPVAAQFAQNVADKIAAQSLEQVAAWRKEQYETARNDPEIGGAKWDETLNFAAKALDTFGAPKGSPFRNALDESGWGNNRDFVAMFAKIGRAVGEDSDFVRGDTGAKTDVPIWDQIYGQPTG